MHQLDYFIMDVFSENALAGNPLAVVMNTVDLNTDRMQAIAREFNLSETTFVARRNEAQERNEGVRVRIFTTQEELPFAGHPTLGTASALKMFAPETVQGDAVKLALNGGPIPVRFEGSGDFGPVYSGPIDSGPVYGEMTQRDPEFGAELEPAVVARLTGLAVDDLDTASPPQVISTGTGFAIVLLRSAEALTRVHVNQQESADWLRERGGRWFYVLAPSDHQEEKFRARMQFNGGEDPATGSAAGCAISYLVAREIVTSGERILVRQGVEINRPSDLFLSARRDLGRITDVRVGGSTVLVAKGQLFLP